MFYRSPLYLIDEGLMSLISKGIKAARSKVKTKPSKPSKPPGCPEGEKMVFGKCRVTGAGKKRSAVKVPSPESFVKNMVKMLGKAGKGVKGKNEDHIAYYQANASRAINKYFDSPQFEALAKSKTLSEKVVWDGIEKGLTVYIKNGNIEDVIAGAYADYEIEGVIAKFVTEFAKAVVKAINMIGGFAPE